MSYLYYLSHDILVYTSNKWSDMHLKIDNVEFEYSSVPVLRDICLDVDGAQFVSILGPNGVGKSTLIHCINKILTPSKGIVTIDGNDVK